MTQSSSTEEEGTAYHEAGHAIMAAIRGKYPTHATIVREANIAGKIDVADDWPAEFDRRSNNSSEKQEHVETLILIKLAASIAHDIRFPNRVHDEGDDCDEQAARNFIIDYAGWAETCRDSYFLQLQQIAYEIIQEHWKWVEAVAAALMEQKTISADEIRTLCPTAYRRAKIKNCD